MGRYIMYPASVSGRKTNNNVCTLSTFCFYLYRSWHSNPATNRCSLHPELRYMHVSLGGFYLSAEKIIKQTRSSFNLEELDEDDDETDKEKV